MVSESGIRKSVQELGMSYPFATVMCFQGGSLKTDECGEDTSGTPLRYDTIIYFIQKQRTR